MLCGVMSLKLTQLRPARCLGTKTHASGLGLRGLGFRVRGLGFRVRGLGFRVRGLGFRV